MSRVSAAIQGSTDTMFYVLAVYFGSVGVKKTRYAVSYALLADVTGSVAGIAAAYIFFFIKELQGVRGVGEERGPRIAFLRGTALSRRNFDSRGLKMTLYCP